MATVLTLVFYGYCFIHFMISTFNVMPKRLMYW